MKNKQIDLLSEVIHLASTALAIQDSASDEFLEASEKYLSALESWRTEFGVPKSSDIAAGNISDPILREMLTKLQSLHKQLSEKAKEARDSVQHEIGGVHKRTQVLRSYVDTLPPRISVAGKREG